MPAIFFRRTNRSHVIALVAILTLAAWLRLTGLTFGLPAVYNPDEVAIVSRALAFAKGDLNPHNFLYPTFFFYVLFCWLGVYFVLSWLTGSIPSMAAFEASFFVDPSGLYLAARLLGVTCGVAGVAATWWFAKRQFGPAVALAAALFVAIAPTAVRDAHYVKHDVPVTLAVILAMVAISTLWPIGRTLRVSPNDTPRATNPAEAELHRRSALVPDTPRVGALIAAGLACGVAFSTHYYAVFLAFPLIFASWWSTTPWPGVRRLRAIGVALAAMAVTFVALSPFIVLEPVTVWRDIVANRQIVVDRAGGAGGTLFASATAYLRMLWSEAIGWPALLLSLWGVFVAWRLSARVAVWFLSFPIAFLAFVSNTVAAGRYLNPVLPFVAVLAALGAGDVAVRLVPRRRALVAAVVVVLAALPGLLLSRHIGLFFRQDDTRTIAKRFIESSLEPGATVLIQPYSVPLRQSREGLIDALTVHLGDPARASTKYRLLLERLNPWPAPSYRLLYLGRGGLDVDKLYFNYSDFADSAGLQRLDGLGVRRVVLKKYNVEDPATLPLVHTLERGGRLVASVTPYRGDAGPSLRAAVAPFLHNTDTPLDPALERPGPIIEIWATR